MKNYLLFASIGLLSLLNTACSSTGQAYLNTIQYVFSDHDTKLTLEQIANSKSDLMRVNIEDRGSVVLALAYIDGDKYRWISGDHIVITMHHGVITQTEGMKHDLYFTGNLNNNPLASDGVLAYSWDRKVDIDSLGYGLFVQSMWRIEGEVTQTHYDHELTMIKITETVVFPDVSPFIEVGKEWKNTYYLDAKSKELLVSSQKISPNADRYEMTYVSRIARIIDGMEQAK